MALVRSWVTLSALTSLVPLASLGLGFAAAACGGSVEVNFVGEDDDGGEGGGSSTCGDGDVDDEETCDDENTEAGDGCNDACATEPGWVCSGEPSSCAQTCGNDELDEGEACEDSNVEDGDGCSAGCQVEGSCDAPVDLVFEEQSNGTELARVESSTAGGGRQVGAADCGGDEAGGGADRVYRLVLEEASDVQIRVSGGFNSVIRLLRADACDTADEVSCRNAGDGNADETLTAPNLEPGTYHVVVDGAASSSQGTFTLSVTRACPLENVALDQFNTIYYYAQNYSVTLRNRSESCGVNLSRLGLTIVGDEASHYELPDRVIDPDERIAVVFRDMGSSNDIVLDAQDELNNVYYENGNALICRGACNSSGSNAIDAIQTGSSAEDLPSDIEFEGGPLTSISSYGMDIVVDYARIAYEGRYPNFLASDWGARVEIRPNRLVDGDITSVIPKVPNSAGSAADISVITDSTYGRVIRLDGPPGDSEYQGFDIPIPAGFKPTNARFRVKKEGAGTNYPYFAALSTDVANWISGISAYLYPEGTTLNVTSLGTTPVTVGTWFLLEYRNMTWPEDGPPTFDVYLDGSKLNEEPLNMPTLVEDGFGHLRVATYGAAGNGIQIAEVIVR